MTSCLHRHQDRERIDRAFERTAQSTVRRNRFRLCGADCWIGSNIITGEHKLFGTFCGDRFCTWCCRKRSAIIKAHLLDFIKDRDCRMMLLTIAHRQDQPLADTLARLHKCLSAFRRTAAWQTHVTGGAAFIEIKHGSNGWHPHCHIIMEGTFWDKDDLRQAWKEVTRDSWITDIKGLKNQELAAYCAKYAAKGMSEALPDEITTDQLEELITALHGRRMVHSFGTWYGQISLTKLLDCKLTETFDPAAWKRCQTLAK